MLVRGDGSIRGTIGGGAVEYRAIQLAMDAMREKVSYTKGFNLTKNEVSDIGMVCGGRVTVYFQYVSPKDEEFRELCLRIQDAFGRDEDSWLVMDISDETCWRMEIGNRREGWENLPGETGDFRQPGGAVAGRRPQLLCGTLGTGRQGLYIRRRACGPGTGAGTGPSGFSLCGDG